jgi:hypothetical protein
LEVTPDVFLDKGALSDSSVWRGVPESPMRIALKVRTVSHSLLHLLLNFGHLQSSSIYLTERLHSLPPGRLVFFGCIT